MAQWELSTVNWSGVHHRRKEKREKRKEIRFASEFGGLVGSLCFLSVNFSGRDVWNAKTGNFADVKSRSILYICVR